MNDDPTMVNADLQRYCKRCRYPLAPTATACPECGRAFDPINRRTFADSPTVWRTDVTWGVIVVALSFLGSAATVITGLWAMERWPGEFGEAGPLVGALFILSRNLAWSLLLISVVAFRWVYPVWRWICLVIGLAAVMYSWQINALL